MKVLVDSTIWSLAIRRRKTTPSPHLLAFNELVRETRVVLIGPIRQEVLSGIRNPSQFRKLQSVLRAWNDLPLDTQDFEHAAEHFNSCRTKGIQGTHTDFLICAVAERHNLAILTTDKDFSSYAAVLPIKLLLPT